MAISLESVVQRPDLLAARRNLGIEPATPDDVRAANQNVDEREREAYALEADLARAA